MPLQEIAQLNIVNFPVPGMDHRLAVIRRDPKLYPNDLPAAGTLLADCDFVSQRQVEKWGDGFVLAKIVPDPATGLHDWYFLNERLNQDAYNYAVSFPYETKDFPQYVRTYVYLRESYTDVEDLSADPVKEDLTLIERKQIRSEDPIIDSLFVVVQRVYEILPGPWIKSFKIHEHSGDVWEIQKRKNKITEVTTSSTITEDTIPKLVVVERDDIGTLTTWETVTTISQSQYNSEESALGSTRAMGYVFPAYITFMCTFDGSSTDVAFIRNGSRAQVVNAEVKTWWVISGTTPTTAVDEIITDTVMLFDREYTGVLHGAFAAGSSDDILDRFPESSVMVNSWKNNPATYPATTPSAVEYFKGIPADGIIPAKPKWVGSMKVVEHESTPEMYGKLYRITQVKIKMI